MFIIDIEASGLGNNSYPIEVAFCDIDGGQRYTTLINPETAGDWESWDMYAEEAVHGISREQLREHGRDVISVANDLTRLLGGQDVYSDAPQVDGVWLRKLFESLGRDNPVRLRALRDIYCSAYQNRIDSRLAKLERPHRALNDCLALASAVRSVIG